MLATGGKSQNMAQHQDENFGATTGKESATLSLSQINGVKERVSN